MTDTTLLTVLLIVLVAIAIIWMLVTLLGRRGTRIVVNKSSSDSVKDDSR